MNSDSLLEKFVPVLLMKTKEVKRLKKTTKNLKRCGTTKLSGARKIQHVCDLCDDKTSRKPNLTKHYFTHTGEKPFECELCDYKATQKGRLAQHQLTHSGAKQFECELCDFKAIQKGHLTYHQLTHTGVNPSSVSFVTIKQQQRGTQPNIS